MSTLFSTHRKLAAKHGFQPKIPNAGTTVTGNKRTAADVAFAWSGSGMELVSSSVEVVPLRVKDSATLTFGVSDHQPISLKLKWCRR